MELNKMIIQGKLTNDPVITIKKMERMSFLLLNFPLLPMEEKKMTSRKRFTLIVQLLEERQNLLNLTLRKDHEFLLLEDL